MWRSAPSTKKATALQLMSEPLNRKLAAAEYQSIARNGLAHMIAIPGPKPAAIRLLIKDVPSGRIGSVHINLEASAAFDSVPAARTAEQPSATTH